MHKIYYIMGKSSSGKDSIFKEIRKRMPKLRSIILYTTRPIRENEINGREYHFINEAEMQELEKKGCVIEQRVYQTKCGIWKYATVQDGQIDLEQFDYLVIGTLESYQAMCAYFGKDRMVPIYIEVEDGLRLERALQREKREKNPRYAEMCRRFLADAEDFSVEKLTKANIIKRFRNEELDPCVEEICSYINGLRN